MNLSRFNVFILSAAASMHALGAVPLEDTKVLTVSGKAIPSACSLSVTSEKLDLGPAAKEPVTAEGSGKWSYWKGKDDNIRVDVVTKCAKAVKSAVRFVDNSGVDVSHLDFGKRKLFGMAGSGNDDVAGFALRETWKSAQQGALYYSVNELVSGTGSFGAGGSVLAAIPPGGFLAKARRVTQTGIDVALESVSEATYELEITGLRKVGTPNSDAIQLSGSLLLELYTL